GQRRMGSPLRRQRADMDGRGEPVPRRRGRGSPRRSRAGRRVRRGTQRDLAGAARVAGDGRRLLPSGLGEGRAPRRAARRRGAVGAGRPRRLRPSAGRLRLRGDPLPPHRRRRDARCPAAGSRSTGPRRHAARRRTRPGQHPGGIRRATEPGDPHDARRDRRDVARRPRHRARRARAPAGRLSGRGRSGHRCSPPRCAAEL
ncbi:MAG: Thioredoxin reductase, partial [uncultured Solirubrobacteraceae bacterium]